MKGFRIGVGRVSGTKFSNRDDVRVLSGIYCKEYTIQGCWVHSGLAMRKVQRLIE